MNQKVDRKRKENKRKKKKKTEEEKEKFQRYCVTAGPDIMGLLMTNIIL